MNEAPFKYDWGETVRITTSAPSPLVPGSEVAVVGMTQLTDTRPVVGGLAKRGQIVYLIEFEDGSSLEVLDKCIESKGD